MQVEIIGRHMSLGADQTAHAEEEARKLGRYFDGVNDVKITFTREHDVMKAEIICLVSGGKTLVAVENGTTIHESLERATDTMARQIKKHKDRLRDHRTHGVAPAPEILPEETEPEAEELAE